MYDQIREDPLYIMLYAVVTALAIMASCYLLFGRANVIAPDIKPPMRLRRWTAAFFASFALNHLWYMPILFDISSENVAMIDLTGGLLDCLTVIPLVIVVLFAMLQDRQRPLWIVAAMMAPLVVGMVWSIAYRSYALQPIGYAYFLIMCIGLSIYMVRAVKQYGKWLRNNYADLEHKEVWQSFVVLAIIMLVFVIYASASEGVIYQYAMQVIIIVLICYLLWRVETLSDLSISQQQSQMVEEPAAIESEDVDNYELPQTIHDKIGALLQQHCIDTQLYLQHDLTIIQLSKAIGTNRFYLSQYFSSQGLTYNAYINNLRINHFIGLYHKAVATQHNFTAKQLAFDSGYRNYQTFSLVFKQLKGQTVTAWMRDTAK